MAAVPATGGREEKKQAPRQEAGRRPGGRWKIGFKMPSRQERAAAVCKKYCDIVEILSGAHHDPETDRVTFTGKMHKAEAPEIVSFLKIALADLYQLNHLTMKCAPPPPPPPLELSWCAHTRRQGSWHHTFFLVAPPREQAAALVPCLLQFPSSPCMLRACGGVWLLSPRAPGTRRRTRRVRP